MLFDEADSASLKTWIATRLQDVSYADSNVLTDYVLALLRYDLPEDEVRKVCVEQLEDFLREHTEAFVNDLFNALSTKEYIPGQRSAPTKQPSFRDVFSKNSEQSPANGQSASRKRAYHERDGSETGDGQPAFGERQFKQMRRGGKFGNGRGNFSGPNAQTDVQMGGTPQGLSGFDPKAMPFDPNDPMSAMMAMQAMQAMGFPPMPSFPGMPMDVSGGQPVRRIHKRCRDYDEKGFCALGNNCPYEHGNDSVAAGRDEYDPNNSSIVERGYSNGRGERGFRGGRSRGDRGRGRGNFGSRGRSEFSSTQPSRDKSNSTIVVENIPDDKLSEESVHEFFGQFGEVAEVTMQLNKKLAIVKFAEWNSAKAAHASPKVIFDNRFVKVFWYKPEDEQQQQQLRSSSQEELRAAPAFDMEEFKKKQEEAQRLYEERARKKLETDEAMRELERRKEQLLQKQAEETRKLQERLGTETGSGTPTDASSPATAALAASPANGASGSPTPTNGKTSAQTEALRAQLAALEAEAKSLGIDSSLPAEDAWSSRGRGGRGGFRGPYRGYAPRGSRGSFRGAPSTFRGRGGFAPRGRGGNSMKLDNRPRKIAVSGFTMDEAKDEALKQHLLSFGDFESIDPNPDRPDSKIITFKERYVAEKFFHNSKEIPQVGAVELAWINTPAPASAPSLTAVSATNGGDHSAGQGQNQGGQQQQQQGQSLENRHEDYDVADDDDGWMVE